MKSIRQFQSLFDNPTRRMLAKNLVLLSGGEFFSRLLTAIAFVYLARVLDPSTYGILEISLALLMVATLLVDMGLGTIGARDIARKSDRSESLVFRIVSTQMGLALGIVLILLVLAILPVTDSILIWLMLGFGISLLGYPLIIYWLFQGRNQMLWVALPQVLRQIVFLVMVLFIVREPKNILGVPLAEIFGIAVAAIVSLLALRRFGDKLRFNLRSGWDTQLLVSSSPIGGAQLIWAFRMYLPTILIGIFIGSAAAGFFAVAHRIMMVSQTLLEAYFRNIFPSMSKAAATSYHQLMRLLNRSMLLLTLFTVALALIVTLGSSLIIGLVFGDTYRNSESVRVLAVLIWMIPILGWRRHSRNALIAIDHQREDFLLALVGVILMIVLAVPATIRLGIYGTALAIVIAELINASLAWWRLMKHLKQPDTKDAEEHTVSNTLAQTDLPSKLIIASKTSLDQISPIFIVGAPRSGTTLLRVLLNRHPSIGLCDETYFFYYAYQRRRAFGDLNDASDRQRLINEYLRTNRIKRLGLDLEKLNEALMQAGESYPSLFLSLLQFFAASEGKTRCGEKTPQHAFYLENLNNWYPNCKIIHIVRDPRDVTASLMRMPWASNSLTSNARTWVRHTISAHRMRDRKNYLLTHYEQIVESPEKELKRICEFIGEVYSPKMLEIGDMNDRDLETTNEWWFQRAKGPLTTARIGTWHKTLNSEEVALVEWIVGSNLKEFGYKPANGKVSRITKVNALLNEAVASVRYKIPRLGHLWYYWFQPTQLVREEAWIDAN